MADVRSPVTNPFEPGSDIVPTIWAGRREHLADFRDRVAPRRRSGRPERGRALLGEPGIGKSSLARRIATHHRDTGGWSTGQIRLVRGQDPLRVVADALIAFADANDLAAALDRRIGTVLARWRKASAAGFTVELDQPTAPLPHRELTTLLTAVAREAAAAGTLLLVHVDEVHLADADELSQLLTALVDTLAITDDHRTPDGSTVDQSLPIAVYLTGLPEFADVAQARTGATFSRRFKTDVLEPLADDDLRDALDELVVGYAVLGDDGPATVTLQPDAADVLVDHAAGDPFLFQLLGQHAWDAGTDPTITTADVHRGAAACRPEAARHVQRLLERLTQLERQFIDAAAQLPPDQRTLTAITHHMDGYDSPTQLGPTAARLESKGVLTRGRPYVLRYRVLEAYAVGRWPAAA